MKQNVKFTKNEIEAVKKNILCNYLSKKKIYDAFAKKMSILLEDVVKENSIDLHLVKSRVKEQNSLLEKIEKKALSIDKSKLYESIDEITDICGIRIILLNEQDIDKVVDIIHKEFNVDEENSEDKRIKDFDRFGYLSYHQVVELNSKRLENIEYSKFSKMKFEIQIRTLLQHAWAEIEHDLGYKSKRNILPSRIKRHLSMLSATLELVDKGFVEIENDSKSKSVDRLSLLEFIEKNKIIKNLDKHVVSNTSNNIDNSIYNFGFIMKNLIFMELNDLSIIESELEKYEDELKLFILQFQKRKRINFDNSGISLIFLSIFIANEKLSLDEFMEYLQEVEIDNYTNIEHLYEQLTNSYKRVKLIKKFNLKGRI